MSIVKRLLERSPSLLNHSYRLNGEPFDPATSLAPPEGRKRSWVHYGVMVPDLPAPHHTFNVLSIVGTPGATVFDNDFAVRTTPRDTAYLLSTMASLPAGQFRSYSIEQECEFSADGTRLRFGHDLVIEGCYPHWTVTRTLPGTTIQLTLEATGCVSHFAHIPGLYSHWSLLSRYTGTIDHDGEKTEVSGLCTFEYAAGVGAYSVPGRSFPVAHKIPLNYFTYQIINLDESTQILLVAVLLPGDFPLQKSVYIRSLNDLGEVYTRNVDFSVTEFQPEPSITPDGFTMDLPRRFRWYAEDDSGNELLSLDCTVKGKYEYGLGAGYTSWYGFDGRVKGEPVSGQGYLEFIDRRPKAEG
ncbi:DUF6670 family protein [uncultured Marinobacter sp.]|uniref:DUF6670 family protein n=1 Tax=uncultured Marinobacter sp. TaxID=187379 RepID=UPI00262CF732|nr:DUF6670 family protein [uncultured Marinobacter sp.]